MGWDNASTVANEVEDPQKTYPRVMMLALAAIFLSYVIPVLAVWHLHVQAEVWSAGSWASIASMVVGPWLGAALVGAAMISEFGTFNSLVMSYSRLPVAMAEDGHLPKIFTRKLKDGAPWVAIIVLGIAWAASLGLSFDKLIMLDILLYGASLVLEFLALIVLRIREPQLARPFRVPGGMFGAIAVGHWSYCIAADCADQKSRRATGSGPPGQRKPVGLWAGSDGAGSGLLLCGGKSFGHLERSSSEIPSEARNPYDLKEFQQ